MSGWSNDLCGCFGDCSACLLAFFCPCIVSGKNAEAISGKDCCLYCCCSWFCHAFFYPGYIIMRTLQRNRIRELKNIDGTMLNDCLCVTFCSLCALVQEKREIDTPGGQAMARE